MSPLPSVYELSLSGFLVASFTQPRKQTVIQKVIYSNNLTLLFYLLCGFYAPFLLLHTKNRHPLITSPQKIRRIGYKLYSTTKFKYKSTLFRWLYLYIWSHSAVSNKCICQRVRSFQDYQFVFVLFISSLGYLKKKKQVFDRGLKNRFRISVV